MSDSEKAEAERVAADRFFGARQEDLESRFAEAASGFDWREERTLGDLIRDAIPKDLQIAIPDEVRDHFKKAQLEVLAGMRSLIEAWVEQLEGDREKSAERQEHITIRAPESRR